MKNLARGLAMSLALWAPARAAETAPAHPPATAQPPASPHRVELVARYLNAIHYDAIVDRIIAALLPPMMKLALSQAPDVSPEQKAGLTEAVNDALAQWHPMFVERFKAELAAVFTDQELEAAVAFYGSPVGKSIIAKQGELSRAGVRIAAELQPQLATMIAAQICKKLDCAKLESPPLDKKS